MPSRSQRSLRESRGVDSSGRSNTLIGLDLGVITIASAATGDITVTMTKYGAFVAGVVPVVSTNDAAVATVATPSATNASGVTTVTITGVAAGTCLVDIVSDSTYATVAVTIT
jgi:hypothetical protein